MADNSAHARGSRHFSPEREQYINPGNGSAEGRNDDRGPGSWSTQEQPTYDEEQESEDKEQEGVDDDDDGTQVYENDDYYSILNVPPNVGCAIVNKTERC